MKTRFRIACVQTSPKVNRRAENLNDMLRAIDMILSDYEDTELIVFPELAVSGYEAYPYFTDLAETEEGVSARTLGQKASQYGIYIAFGLPLIAADGKLYNSQLLLGRDGRVLGRYDKVHLFDQEKAVFSPGDRFPVFETDLGRIGLFICYDAFFPECARILATQGAVLLVNSTNWEAPYRDDMLRVMTSRALENVCYLACANRVGKDKKLSFFGCSRILDPSGNALAECPENEPGYCTAVLSMDTM